MSEALRLAEYCEGLASEIDHSHFTHDLLASAEALRRLASVEDELHQAREELAALRASLGEPVPEVVIAHYGGQTRGIGYSKLQALVDPEKLPIGAKLYAIKDKS